MSELNPVLALNKQISKLWNAVSTLRLLSHTNDKAARIGEFPDSVEFIADGLTKTISDIQKIIDDIEAGKHTGGKK